MDREADSYDILATLSEQQRLFVIRSFQDRTAAPMSSPCTTGYRAACRPPTTRPAGGRHSRKLAALVEAG